MKLPYWVRFFVVWGSHITRDKNLSYKVEWGRKKKDRDVYKNLEEIEIILFNILIYVVL